jgi:metal-responsive CopG/Arc/MetJ family transcriptional regulator
MALEKRTYTLPPAALAQFEQEVPEGKRSSVIAALIRNWLHRRSREDLREQVVLGCCDMATEYRGIEAAYHPLEEEVERGLIDGSSAR